MNLLDTHALIWALSAPAKLSPAARRIVEEGEVAVSAVCLWEMALKKGRQSEIVPDPMAWWERHVRKAGVTIVPIKDVHIMHLDALPPHHTDPFDRILVCQCIHERMRLVTRDQSLRDYYHPYVHIVW